MLGKVLDSERSNKALTFFHSPLALFLYTSYIMKWWVKGVLFGMGVI
jgi:hypothetical protein